MTPAVQGKRVLEFQFPPDRCTTVECELFKSEYWWVLRPACLDHAAPLLPACSVPAPERGPVAAAPCHRTAAACPLPRCLLESKRAALGGRLASRAAREHACVGRASTPAAPAAARRAEVTLCTGLASNLKMCLPLTVKLVPSSRLEEAAPPAVIVGWCPMQVGCACVRAA